MKFHVIGGLPRSGSTLLCNILNQNPRFYASSTSVLPAIYNSISMALSNTPEYRSELRADREKTEEKTRNAIRSFTYEWYKVHEKEVVFDKSRGWGHHLLLLRDLFPDIRPIICVRDLRNVFGSMEKQHQKNPILDQAGNPGEKTVYSRADSYFSPQGMIGFPLEGIQDAIRRDGKRLIIVQYEFLVRDPQSIMDRIYRELGEDSYEHDFERIENTAIDTDEMYLNKFPHEGTGKVEEVDPDEWKKFVSTDITELIMSRYSWFNNTFGYL